ncbi:MAG: choice-of-anchor Q domain-containing protein [Chthoniobacterales bacterium]
MQKSVASTAAALAVFASLAAFSPQVAQAATLIVDRFDDPKPANASACSPAGNDCSLRGAVIKANRTPGADTIRLQGGTYTLTRAGSGGDENTASVGDLDLKQPVTVIGVSGTIIDAAAVNDRAFEVSGSGTFTLKRVVIRGGQALEWQANYVGGGILTSNPDATLILTGVTLRGNVAGDGGGLFSYGPVIMTGCVVTGNSSSGIDASNTITITNSTISGNKSAGIHTDGPGQISRSTIANNSGAGLKAKYAESWTIAECTISGNTGDGVQWSDDEGDSLTIVNSTISGNGGTGVWALSAPAVSVDSSTIVRNARGLRAGLSEGAPCSLSYRNSVIADNGVDCSSTVGGVLVSQSFNLGSDGTCAAEATDATAADPKLGPLGAHGGPTMTHALLPGSPAIDSGAVCPATDQRDVSRPRDGDGNGSAACDRGSFER